MAGVRHAEVGGRLMLFVRSTFKEDLMLLPMAGESKKGNAKEWLDKGLYPTGCAGSVAIMLSEYFDISISPASSPENLLIPKNFFSDFRIAYRKLVARKKS